MEIQQGKGPWASPVNGIVPLGTTLTMVVGIDDKEGKRKNENRHKSTLAVPGKIQEHYGSPCKLPLSQNIT